ncbi:hypothetical protein ACFRMQ_16500 [Kitasatospora sp. NPDC056783]|uniref:hypothetical protein n=1 Tax=Kitasatospora sp. NPDC056783 TaxID=3345943 RepID=UPI00368FD2B6
MSAAPARFALDPPAGDSAAEHRRLRALFERFPDLSLAVPDAELRPSPSLVVNSLRELSVRLR